MNQINSPSTFPSLSEGGDERGGLNHLAIIMDGNRRWAKAKGKLAAFGHFEGYKRFVEIAELCRQKGIKILTVYAFSTENWGREKEEVDALMELLATALKDQADRLMKDNIKLKVIGRISDLPQNLQVAVKQAEEKTAANTNGILNIALSYGGRAEIVDAAKSLVADGIKPEEITDEALASRLYTAGQIDPDLIVRCGGHKRLSNFLLWQSAYSEIYFTDTLWPDFDEKELDQAIEFFDSTKKNFGK
ncbi:MAG: polyprenyl diphosphate synthase [Patescibacteria group bacterium]